MFVQWEGERQSQETQSGLGRAGAGRGKAILRANSVRAKIRLGPATLQTSQIRSGGSLVCSGCDIDVYIDMHNLQRKGCLNAVYP